jgi:hypothetical protein
VTAAAVFDGTMQQTGTQIVVTIGAQRTGTTSIGILTTTPMGWTPSSAATDLAGNPGSTPAVTESGLADVDF